MGRPKDAFVRKHAVHLGGTKWKCNHCGRILNGSATRIRNHISGQGNGVSACAALSEEAQAEVGLRQKAPNKRQLQAADTTTSELNVTDAVVKFFMCQNISSDLYCVMRDPNLREFLERAYRFGVPSSLLGGDSLVVEKSLLNIKEEVYQHMLNVRESWGTSGCTLMGFKGEFEKDSYVLGFYCPKGFIFVEVPRLVSGIGEALKRHSPSLDIVDVTHVIYHSHCSSNGFPLPFCKLSDQVSCNWTTSVAHEHCSGIHLFPCVQHGIRAACHEACERSEWAMSLISKAHKLHLFIVCSSLQDWYCKISREKGFGGGNLASHISHFLSIMFLEDELKMRLSYHLRFDEPIANRVNLEAILDDVEFWSDGRELKRVLALVLKIADAMDTLIPTAGYLSMATYKAKHVLFNEFKRPIQDDTFWTDLYSGLSLGKQGSAAYLNPVYFVQANLREDLVLKESVTSTLQVLVREEELEEIKEQLQKYIDEYSNRFVDICELRSYHPVKLWDEQGHDLPLLRKYAIKLLSQPVSCMCNQVEKHIFQLQGTQDWILRLNLRMMQEFRNLGANIYTPIELEFGSD